MSVATENLAPPQPGGPANPPFFAVSIPKLIVMSVCTLGLYELYWFYRNWCLVREREKSNIQPFWRAAFAMLFCYAMFRRVREYPTGSPVAATLAADPLPAGLLAAAWIVTSLLWMLPDPYALVTFGSFLFMVPVQTAAQRVNEAVAPGHDPNARFTLANWVIVVLGGILAVLAVIGAFTPDNPGVSI